MVDGNQAYLPSFAGGFISVLSQGNNIQKREGGCLGPAGDRRRSTTRCDALCGVELAPGLHGAEGAQDMCRTAAGEVRDRRAHCWHNRCTWGLWVIVRWYHCVAWGCCGLHGLGSFSVWGICERSLCFSAFSNRQKYLGRNSRS